VPTFSLAGDREKASTGTSITDNTSGPIRFTFHPDGSITAEFFGRSGNIDVEGTRLFIFSGRLVIEFAPNGVGTFVSQNGHEEDLCAALS
jgi:hypothetical protein